MSKLSSLFSVAVVLAILIGLTGLLFSATATFVVGAVAVVLFATVVLRSRA